MGSESPGAVRRVLGAAAVAAAVAAAATGCGAGPAPQSPPAAAPAVPPMDAPFEPANAEGGKTPPPQGVPAQAWAALENFLDVRTAAGAPLPEPAADPDCSLPGPGCTWDFGAETLVWSAGTGPRALRAEIYDRWKSSVRSLGWPVTSEYLFGGDYRTDFEKGSLIYVPRLGRIMDWNPAVEKAAVVIGDSQAGHDTWVGKGLASLGYTPVILGAGGTGYTQGNGTVDNYPSALETEQWLMPWGDPGLVVLQGGGNDAYGADNTQIRQNALQLIREVKRTYPRSRIVVVGVIGDGTGRRAEIDDLLGRVAAEQGLDFLSPRNWWKRYSLTSKLADGLHLSQAGHTAAAPVFARELGAVLKQGGD
ncbi:GDSL-type esterase/lipase family protein [Arthrobacter sp. Edens01]|uniref:GDSL-type esterase/lipase family protein n=1 Tax=Arthrobacter sp. Edens01 TaxID=1732020 RepID=UPI000A7F607E|nr:GDSL-type esterase/lipase family protein [Arthrobacter sp. Edens01]